jgi:hypothetical protein
MTVSRAMMVSIILAVLVGLVVMRCLRFSYVASSLPLGSATDLWTGTQMYRRPTGAYTPALTSSLGQTELTYAKPTDSPSSC